MKAAPPLGLYIHWPYCARICPYCDFNVVRDRGGEKSALVGAIIGDRDFGPRAPTMKVNFNPAARRAKADGVVQYGFDRRFDKPLAAQHDEALRQVGGEHKLAFFRQFAIAARHAPQQAT